MCEDYHLVNNRKHVDKHAMPLLEKIFDNFGHAKVFNTLDLKSNDHQLPLREGDCEVTFHPSIPGFMR
jgi:hypothetical protein